MWERDFTEKKPPHTMFELTHLKTPRSHSDLGLQYPNSEQHDEYCGQTVYFKAEGLARKGAAAQEPSPVPAPKRPAWQLASKVAKHACVKTLY